MGEAGGDTREWTVVIPVKGTARAKSRFGGAPGEHAELAMAIALDTVASVLETPAVAEVLVVTNEAASAGFTQPRLRVVLERGRGGLAAAIALGIATALTTAAPGHGIAVLLGDLPALLPSELDAALRSAAAVKLAMVADAEGLGTTLITAAYGVAHTPAFGPGSSAEHRAAGYIPLDVPAQSGLRNDVDTIERLHELEGRLGPLTTSALNAN
jgi:2-phospho-L-lactate guanylyltransferase